MAVTKKKPQRTLDITKGVGLAASHGLASTSRLGECGLAADTSSAPSNVGIADSGYLRIVESIGSAKKTIQADKALSDIGRRQRFHLVATEAAKKVMAIGRPVVETLAKRISTARESFGSAGGPITGAEAVRHLAKGRTTGFRDDAAGQLQLERLKLTANHLLHLADQPSKAEELQDLLRDAAGGGDIALWSALDVLLEYALRDRVLRAAGLLNNPTILENMRRTLRATLDPAGASQLEALKELGEHAVANLRSAIDACDRAGYRPEPDGERLEIQLARVLEPLAVQLGSLGVQSADLGPTAGAR